MRMRILALEARKQYPNRPVLPMTFHTQQDAPYSLQVQDQVDTFATAEDYRQTNGFGDPRPESIISYGPISSYEGSQTITPISHASVGASTAPFENTLSGEDEEESNNDSLRLAMTSGIPLIRKIYPEMQAPALTYRKSQRPPKLIAQYSGQWHETVKANPTTSQDGPCSQYITSLKR
ncbi:hypothetical protein SK128_020352 [Halocaridina rubra]|uniref:Uncharacterized protein n=1 Tax=Halocaridina rubra TaxID=373956 RepID=A0AAN9A6G5_HALRR